MRGSRPAAASWRVSPWALSCFFISKCRFILSPHIPNRCNKQNKKSYLFLSANASGVSRALLRVLELFSWCAPDASAHRPRWIHSGVWSRFPFAWGLFTPPPPLPHIIERGLDCVTRVSGQCSLYHLPGNAAGKERWVQRLWFPLVCNLDARGQCDFRSQN